MSDLPPPPSYSSLFVGGSGAAPPPPGQQPTAPPPVQPGLKGAFPPSHPYYPGPTSDGPQPGAAAAGYPPPQAPFPPPGAPAPYAPGSSEKPPIDGTVPTYPPPGGASSQYPPPPGTYPPSAGAPYPSAPGVAPYPSTGPFGSFGPPAADGTQPPSQTDPLLNPAYPPVGPYNAAQPYGPHQVLPPASTNNIPIVIDDTPEVPVNPRAPQECALGSIEQYPDLHIAPGQREHIDQIEDDAEPAYFKHCCIAFWSIGAHVSFAICVVLLIWQVPLKGMYDEWWSQASRSERLSEPNKYGYDSTTLICASVFLCVCYLIALIEGCSTDTDAYISNIKQLAEFKQEHEELRKKVPTVVFKAEAYHHAKERIEWRNGRIVSRRRSSDTHRCVTYMEERAFAFSRCVDASGPFDNFKKGVINRIEFEKTFGFLDEATEIAYKMEKDLMIARTKDKDESHEFTETLVMPEFKERTTVYMEEGCRTSLMSSSVYNCLACILCTWPYRLFFRLSTTKRKYTYVKLIGQ